MTHPAPSLALEKNPGTQWGGAPESLLAYFSHSLLLIMKL